MKRFFNLKYFTYFSVFIAVLALLTSLTPLFAEDGDQELTGYAWSSNIGWISFNCDQTDSGGSNECTPANGGSGISDYAVTLKSDGTLTGWAWSSNIGWIQFGGLDTADMPTGSGTTQVNAKLDAEGDGFIGWVRAIEPNISGVSGWDGWISLKGDAAVAFTSLIDLGINPETPNSSILGCGVGTNNTSCNYASPGCSVVYPPYADGYYPDGSNGNNMCQGWTAEFGMAVMCPKGTVLTDYRVYNSEDFLIPQINSNPDTVSGCWLINTQTPELEVPREEGYKILYRETVLRQGCEIICTPISELPSNYQPFQCFYAYEQGDLYQSNGFSFCDLTKQTLSNSNNQINNPTITGAYQVTFVDSSEDSDTTRDSLSGYAWGDEVVGWISFPDANYGVKIKTPNAPQIPNFKCNLTGDGRDGYFALGTDIGTLSITPPDGVTNYNWKGPSGTSLGSNATIDIGPFNKEDIYLYNVTFEYKGLQKQKQCPVGVTRDGFPPTISVGGGVIKDFRLIPNLYTKQNPCKPYVNLGDVKSCVIEDRDKGIEVIIDQLIPVPRATYGSSYGPIDTLPLTPGFYRLKCIGLDDAVVYSNYAQCSVSGKFYER